MKQPIIIGCTPNSYYTDMANELAKLVPDNQVTIVNTYDNGSWYISEIQIDGQKVSDVAFIFEQTYHDDWSEFTPKETADFILELWKTGI